ncbi:MAG: AAA family ATPase, partial [Desulfurococcales archaeon]|nr:AAA family ATPase [Desulfurococcales archaeon]
GLAGVLSGDPQYLLLDEPTGHLDSQGSRVLADILRELRARGKGVVVASHDSRIWALADKCYTVNRSLAEGCPGLPSLPERPPGSINGGVVLELRDVWASYPGGPPVLRGVSLEARGGELTAITGPNGAGKTTVLLVASGILKPSRGRITLREKPALLPADPLLLFSRGTLREELKEQGRRVPQWALGVADKPLLRASGGELRLAALALVAGSGRRLLLVDEPTVGLDPWNRRSIAEVLLGLAGEGYAVVYTTHDDELASLANRVYVVEGGVARRA